MNEPIKQPSIWILLMLSLPLLSCKTTYNTKPSEKELTYAMVRFYINDAESRIYQEPYQYSEILRSQDSIEIKNMLKIGRNWLYLAEKKENVINSFELPLNESHWGLSKINDPREQLIRGTMLARYTLKDPSVKKEVDSFRYYTGQAELILTMRGMKYEETHPGAFID